MPEISTHGAFVLAAYTAAAVILGSMIVSTVLAHRSAQRQLAAAEREAEKARSTR